MTERKIVVRVADRAVGERADVLVTFGLGSCIAVLLHDPERQVGGLAHVLLPDLTMARDRSNPSKFATTAIPLLLDEMGELGADPARTTARLVGGASMFGGLMTTSSMNMGAKNIERCREVLHDLNLRIAGELVGGEHGRSVYFDVTSGTVRITAALREDVFI